MVPLSLMVSLSPSRTCALISCSQPAGHVVRRIITPSADSNVSVQRIAGSPSNHRHQEFRRAFPGPLLRTRLLRMAARAWLDDTGRADRFVVWLKRHWPGRHTARPSISSTRKIALTTSHRDLGDISQLSKQTLEVMPRRSSSSYQRFSR